MQRHTLLKRRKARTLDSYAIGHWIGEGHTDFNHISFGGEFG